MGLDLKRLRTDFATIAKDGKITDTDVDGLLRRVKRDGLTESEAKTLKKETARYKDQFTPEGAKKIDAFIANKLRAATVLDDPTPVNPLGVKDPAVLKADLKRLRQTDLKGVLVKGGIDGNDVTQKYLADCYLIAAMAATARANPELIEKAFKKRSDGTYDVTIYEQKGAKWVPTKVHIDADLPHNDWYHLQYASARDEKELWPALLEKAFAAKAGSYTAIEGGVPGDALSALTGKPTTMIDFQERGVKADQVFEALSLAVKERRPATASTYGESSNAKYTNSGLYSDHAYSVWGTETSGGKKYVQLRNPWGESEPANNGRDDGIFKMELGEFMKMYANVEINGG
ncbi:MAG: C2 family cysteine protease [Archangium sp.]|nr:C2 family cysteine protease [Archangium sp.]